MAGDFLTHISVLMKHTAFYVILLSILPLVKGETKSYTSGTYIYLPIGSIISLLVICCCVCCGYQNRRNRAMQQRQIIMAQGTPSQACTISQTQMSGYPVTGPGFVTYPVNPSYPMPTSPTAPWQAPSIPVADKPPSYEDAIKTVPVNGTAGGATDQITSPSSVAANPGSHL